MPKTTPEKQLAIVAAKELRQRERRTAKALLVTEAQALAAYRKPIRQATDAVIAANARGANALTQLSRQTTALQAQLQEEVRRSHVAGRAAGRHRLEVELGQPLHAAAGALEDEAFADIVAQGIVSAWGSSGLSLLGGNPITVTARDLDQLVELVDGRVRRAAATETARVFNREREALIDDVVGHYAASTRGPRDPDVPAAGAFKVWSAILDRATCPRCFALDGEIVELHKSFSAGSPPPLHPHCRCIVEFIVVHKPERLEDIAIDYGLFKQELHDLIIEGRAESNRHAVSFASDSLGSTRSPATLTQRFAGERYATTRTPFSGGGGGPGVRRIVPVVPRSTGGAPPPRPPGGGGGGSGSGGGGPRKPLDFQFGFTREDVKKLGDNVVCTGNISRVTRQLFGRQCPTPESWHRLFEVPPGYSLSFKAFSENAEKGLFVRAKIVHPDGREIGTLARTFSKDAKKELVVEHGYFEIPNKADRGNGVAKSVNRAALQGYREMGVKRIEITAGLEDGSVVWAKQGFSWAPSQPIYEKKFFDFLYKNTGDAVMAQQVAQAALEGAFRVVEVEHQGRKLGEEFLRELGGWSGGLRLDDADPGFRYAKKRFGL